MLKLKKLSGPMFKQRMIIKTFSHAHDAHKFMNDQDNNDWSEYTGALTSGTYAFVAQTWINTNKLPADMLAHI